MFYSNQVKSHSRRNGRSSSDTCEHRAVLGVSGHHLYFFLLSTIFYFLFFHTQHNIISKIQQNKTTDTYSTSQGPIKREGDREGQQEHKSHSFI